MRKKRGSTYQLAPKLFTIGVKAIDNYSILDIVYPKLKEITVKIHQSCHFSTKVQDRVVILSKVDSPTLGVSIKPGYNRALEESTSGKAILAFLPDELLHSTINAIAKKHNSSFMRALSRDLAKIKKQCYNIEESEYVEGIIDLAVPILPKDERDFYSCLCVPYLKNKTNTYTQEDILEILQSYALDIAQNLV